MLDRERTGALYCVPKLDLLDFEYVICKVSCNRYRIAVCVRNSHCLLACFVRVWECFDLHISIRNLTSTSFVFKTEL